MNLRINDFKPNIINICCLGCGLALDVDFARCKRYFSFIDCDFYRDR